MSELPTGIVTFLFTDIEGSTQLLQALGEAYEPLQEQHQQILRRAIQGGGGTEIKTEGDSFFAVFPNPAQALGAAVEAQRRLAATPWPHGRPLRVRMGIHTGEGRLFGDDYLGIEVNRAARIAAAAHGGQVVVSDATRSLTERILPEGVVLRDLGRHRLKDLTHPERLYDLEIEGLPSTFPQLKSLEARPNNLPLQRSTFIGREDDVEMVIALVRSNRLVTLTGPGGAGKTRLSVEAGRALLPEFPDGAFFVDLSVIADRQLVPSAVAQALGLAEQAERAPLETVRQHLRDLRLLLVLDNFEQVVAAAETVEGLLEGAAKLHVLVTSRIPLHLYGEQEFAVPPLALPDPARLPPFQQLSQYDAVELFIERARAVRRDFEVTNANAPAVAEICVRLDGLPLAIELAAVRVKVMSPEQILARLEHRLPLLTTGARDLPERQRTLRNAIAWSYDLLDEPERALVACLGVFAGGATLEAIEDVCNPGGELGLDTLDGVVSLVDKSLVRRIDVAGGDPRFGMLETIREFAVDRLPETERDEVLRRHAGYFAALAEEAEPHFVGADDAVWLGRFELEHDNIRTALRWAIAHGEAALGLRLGASIWRFWFQRGHLREGYAWMAELLDLPQAADHEAAYAHAQTAAGGLAYWLNDMERTERHYREALAVYRTLDDRNRLAEALTNVAFIPLLEHDYDAAVPLFEEALAMARQVGDPTRLGETVGALGYALLMKRDLDAALPLLEEELGIARRAGNRFQTADALAAITAVHMLRRDHEQARRVAEEAISVFKDLQNAAGVSMMLETLAAMEGEQGGHERAARLSGAAAKIRDTIGGGAPPTAYMFEDPIPAARAAIGDGAVDRLIQEGREMALDKAVAYALDAE